MSAKLLPCPFCGGKALRIRKAIGFDTVAVIVKCGRVRCPVQPQTTPCDEKGILRGKAGAVEAWHRRADAEKEGA